jgi:hypothetical protein
MTPKPCSNAEQEPSGHRDDRKQAHPPVPTGLEDPGNSLAVILPQRPPPGRPHAHLSREPSLYYLTVARLRQGAFVGARPSNPRELRGFPPAPRGGPLTGRGGILRPLAWRDQCKRRADPSDCRSFAALRSVNRQQTPKDRCPAAEFIDIDAQSANGGTAETAGPKGSAPIPSLSARSDPGIAFAILAICSPANSGWERGPDGCPGRPALRKPRT